MLTKTTKSIVKNKQHGMTLLELLVVIVIMAIIATFALPSYRQFNRQKHVDRFANQFANALQFAKRQATITAHTVSICPTDNLQNSPIICLNNWEDLAKIDNPSRGWLIFRDKNHNNKREKSETLYRKFNTNDSLVNLSWTGRYPVIKVFPQSTSGSSGSMRIYSPRQGVQLNKWHNKKTPFKRELLETRIILSSLGKVTYKSYRHKNE